jgi:hypothetical protein
MAFTLVRSRDKSLLRRPCKEEIRSSYRWRLQSAPGVNEEIEIATAKEIEIRAEEGVEERFGIYGEVCAQPFVRKP